MTRPRPEMVPEKLLREIAESALPPNAKCYVNADGDELGCGRVDDGGLPCRHWLAAVVLDHRRRLNWGPHDGPPRTHDERRPLVLYSRRALTKAAFDALQSQLECIGWPILVIDSTEFHPPGEAGAALPKQLLPSGDDGDLGEIDELGAREDQLAAIYRAAGGERQDVWVARMPPLLPPDSGDAGDDALHLVTALRDRVESAEADLVTTMRVARTFFDSMSAALRRHDEPELDMRLVDELNEILERRGARVQAVQP